MIKRRFRVHCLTPGGIVQLYVRGANQEEAIKSALKNFDIEEVLGIEHVKRYEERIEHIFGLTPEHYKKTKKELFG
jgi:acetyl-CoA carboxylase alpha subunit